MKKAIQTSNAPSAIGPYSQAVRANGFIFISGQLPVDSSSNTFSGDDIASQTHQSLHNIGSILNELNLEMNAIVKTTVYLTDMADFQAMNVVYTEFFEAPYPARAAVEVRSLPKGARIEIAAVAIE